MSHHHTQKPRYNTVERHEQHNAEKIGLSLLLAFGLALIAIICNFFFEFLGTYKSEINAALYWVAIIAIIAIGSCLIFTAIYYCSMLWLNFDMKRSKTAHIKEKLRTETINNRLADSTQLQMNQGLVYLSEQETEYGKVKFKSLPSRRSPRIENENHKYLPESEPENNAIKNTLLDDISNQQRLLLVGGQGTGKTTLLQHIAHQRDKTTLILILDSHNTPKKWAANFRVIGNGRDYDAIQNELEKLVKLMDYRYKELASGKVSEGSHSTITVISDEWTTLSKNLNNLDKLLLPLLTESRKVCIDFILATHSETAQSLGIKGMYDLKDNFDSILRLKNKNGIRLVEIGKNTYNHSGAFINDFVTNKINLDDILNQDSIIIDAFNKLKSEDNFSWNKLSKLIYEGKSNGRYIAKIRSVLDSHGIAY